MGPSKHAGGSRSTVEHTIKLAIELRRPPNSWEIFKKLHKIKDGSFVDAKSKCINISLFCCSLIPLGGFHWDKMADVMVAALSSSSDDSQKVQELNMNRLYYDVVGEEKKMTCVWIGLSRFDYLSRSKFYHFAQFTCGI